VLLNLLQQDCEKKDKKKIIFDLIFAKRPYYFLPQYFKK